MIIGSMMATIITEKFGRRLTITLFNLPIIANWIILYYARDGYIFIIARVLAGVGFGGTLPIIYMTTAEYSSPKLRGTCLAIITTMSAVGGTLGEVLGVALHWRSAALLAVVPALLAAILPIFYVESPQWLASKGRFDECEIAFKSLHGNKKSSEKELRLILEVEKCKQKDTGTYMIQRFKAAVTKTYFWNVLLLTTVIYFYKMISGNILKGMLGVSMLQNLTGSSHVLYYTILVNVLMFLGSITSNVLVSKFKTRTLLFSGGISNNIILIILCILMYLKSINLTFNPWVNATLFGIYYFVLNASVFPLLEKIPPEMYPLDIKAVFITIATIFSTICTFVYSKFIPSLFIDLEFHGVSLLNVIAMSLCLLVLWLKLPETSNRTLQEIELYFKNKTFVNIDDILETDQIKQLV